MALIPISTGPSSRYQLPDMRPITQGYSAFGAGIGRGLEKLFERRREDEAKAANKEWLGQFLGKPLKPEDVVRGVLGAPSKEAANRLLQVGSLLPAAKKQGPMAVPAGSRIWDPATGDVLLDAQEKPATPETDYQNFVSPDGTKGKAVLKGSPEAAQLAAAGWTLGKKQPPEKPSEPRIPITLMPPDGGAPRSFRPGDPKVDEMMAQGWTVMRQGISAASRDAFTPPEKVEVKLTEDQIAADKQLDSLRNMSEIIKANPHFLELPYKGKMEGYSWADKFGQLGEGGKAELAEYKKAQAFINRNMNDYIKYITGAQMSEKEAVRLMKAVPNLKDSPTAFMAKLDAVEKILNDAQRRRNEYIEKNSVLPTKEQLAASGNLDWSGIDRHTNESDEPKAEAGDGAFDPDAIMGLSDEEFAAREGEISDWMLEPATVGKLSNEQFDKIMKRLGIE